MPVTLRLAVVGGAALVLAACSSSTGGTGSNDGTGPTGASTAHSSDAPTTSASPPAASSGPTGSTAAAGSTSATPSSSGPAGVPSCTGGQVAVGGHFDEGGSAAGHERAILTITNTSSSTCSLFGYPGVDGIPPRPGPGVIEHFTRSLRGMMGGLPTGNDTRPTVVLHPGQVASAIVESSTVPQGGQTDCTPFQHLNVTAPNTTVTVIVPINALPSCNPQVHPVVAGASG